MTNKERLTQLLESTPYCENDCYLYRREYTVDEHKKYLNEVMVNHLLSNGVVYPRCKVGDAVYYINRKEKRIFHTYIKYITITTTGLSYVTYWDSTYHDEDFDEVIFLSEEKAKKALGEEE
jgi:hypothetical protein